MKPMLAKVYNPKKPMPYPLFVQPKLDGFRCLAKMINGKVECWSRPSRALPNGKRFETTGHIEQELQPLMIEGDVFDGELYYHGWEFSTIAKHVKDIKNNFGIVEYHIYDAIRPGVTLDRIVFIQDRISCNNLKFVKLTKTIQADNEQEMQTFTEIFVKQGYEGSILRAMDGEYEQGKRSPKLLKYKTFDDDEFEVIQGHSGEGKEEGLVIWECITGAGVPFRCRPEGTYAERREMYDQRDCYVGNMLTVKFFGYGTHGAPRFPVGLHFKEDI
jgi:hypothetical protein